MRCIVLTQKRERSGDKEGHREGGSRGGRGRVGKGGELEAMCVLMLCSFLK